MNARDILRAARVPAFWRTHVPSLHIGEVSALASAVHPAMSIERARFRASGWARFERAIPAASTASLADAIRRLHDASIPAPCVYVFDEPWTLATALAPTFTSLLGVAPRLLPDVWAWYIPSESGARGWTPHRGVTERDTPIVNVWVALSDVGAESACMHVVPLDRDPNYPDALDRIDADESLAVALPVPRGSVLAWNANVLHWGGAMKPGAPPRVSLSFSFHTQDGFAPQTPPKFEERVDLVADMLVTYESSANVTGPWLEWARLWSGMRAARRT